MLRSQRRQHADHDDVRTDGTRALLGIVEARSQLRFEFHGRRADQAARPNVDLDIELPEFGLKVLVRDHREHLGVAHRRILLGVDEIELDLQAGQRTFEIEPGLGEHAGEHVQTASHLGPILSPILSSEVPALDVLTHDRHLPPRRDSNSLTDPPASRQRNGGSGCRHPGRASSCQRARQGSTIDAQSDPRGHWTRTGSHTQDIRLTEASMEPNSSTPGQPVLAELRRHRAELLEAMSAVEQALAAPAPGRQGRWAEGVHVALAELSANCAHGSVALAGPPLG